MDVALVKVGKPTDAVQHIFVYVSSHRIKTSGGFDPMARSMSFLARLEFLWRKRWRKALLTRTSWHGHRFCLARPPPKKKTEASERIPGNSGMQTFSRHTVFLGVPRTSARGGSFKLSFWRKWRVMAAASLVEGSRMVPASTSTTLGWQWKKLSDIGEDWPCDISDVMEHCIAGQGGTSSRV